MMELQVERLVGRDTAAPLPSARDALTVRPPLEEAIEARAVVERVIARLAAIRRTEADLRRLDDALRSMQAAGADRGAFDAADFAFHLALCGAAHNHVLAHALASLHDPVREMIALFSEAAFRGGRVDDLVDAHAALAEAVRRQDADGAPAMMTAMMCRLREETCARSEEPPPLSIVGPPARASKGDRS